MNGHVGEDAELYPLGLLDDAAAAAVEAHVAQCAPCAARVADARVVAASLAAALPEVPPSPSLRRRLLARRPPAIAAWVAAAVIALALAATLWQNAGLRSGVSQRDTVLATIVHSHFNHTAMRVAARETLAAKVLYARDGSWIYVVVDDPGGALDASGRSASASEPFGTLESDGATAWIFVRPRDRLHTVSLLRKGVEVARATLVY